jgi:RHS repeat-associated protein
VSQPSVFQIGSLSLERRRRVGSRPAGGRSQTRAVPDGNGRLWEMTSEAGRLIGVLEPDGSRTRYRYDSAGRLIARTDARGRTTHYGYDTGGRLALVESPDGVCLALEHDEQGRLIRRVLPSGSATAFEYSSAGPLAKADFGPGEPVSFAYDGQGRLRGVAEPGCETCYAYGPEGRVSEITRRIDGVPFMLRVDAQGQPAALHLPDGTALDLGESAPEIPLPLWDEELRFDHAGNVTAAGTREGLYDSCDQLIETRDAGSGTVLYEYDSAGNRILRRGPEGETRYVYDERDRLTCVAGPGGERIDLEYDAAGNLVRKTAAGVTWSYGYNGRQQLISIRRDDRIVGEYRYDFEGRRIWRRTEHGTTLYHYAPSGTLIATTRPDGRPIAVFFDRGRAVRCGDRVLFLQTDHLGSTRRVVGGDGGIVLEAAYSPFGRLLAEPPSFEIPLFTGHLWDMESGLYCCGVRSYDPVLGRFLTPDPWSWGPEDVRLLAAPGALPAAWLMQPKAANPYVYCRNNPLTYRDPEGLSVWGTIGKTVLAFLWSSVWTLLGAAVTVLDWIFQFPLLGFLYLPKYGIDGVSSGRLGSAAMINIGGLGPSPLVLANILFARRGFVDDLNDTVLEYIIPVEAHHQPRVVRTAKTAYFEHLLSHTVQANFSGPFWPFVYLFGSDAMEKDAVRDSGFTRIAEPTLTMAPDKVYTSAGCDAIVIGGQKPYTLQVSNAAAGAIGAVTDNPRFSEAHLTPQYRPGDYTMTVRDNAGITDTRDFEIVELRISDIELISPTHIPIDEVSEPAIPTLRIIDAPGVIRSRADVKFEIKPSEGEMFLEVVDPTPADPPPLVLSTTGGIGDVTTEIRLQNLPAGPAPEDFMVNVRAWNQTGAVIKQLRIRALRLIDVVLRAHIVRKDDGTDAAATVQKLREYVQHVNTLWRQAGIQFAWRLDARGDIDVHFIDETDFLTISVRHIPPAQVAHVEAPTMFRWRSAADGGPFAGVDPAIGALRDHNNQDPNVIHVYWIDDFDPPTQPGGTFRVLAFADTPGNYLVLTRSSSADDMAHELGHNLSLRHPDQHPPGVPAPDKVTERLMYSQSAESRGQRHRIANNEPARGVDETRAARLQANLRTGP